MTGRAVHSRLARQGQRLFVGIVEPELSDAARTNAARAHAALQWSPLGASQAAFNRIKELEGDPRYAAFLRKMNPPEQPDPDASSLSLACL